MVDESWRLYSEMGIENLGTAFEMDDDLDRPTKLIDCYTLFIDDIDKDVFNYVTIELAIIASGMMGEPENILDAFNAEMSSHELPPLEMNEMLRLNNKTNSFMNAQLGNLIIVPKRWVDKSMLEVYAISPYDV